MFIKKISSLEIAAFFRQFATLVHAGIPIVQSLEMLSHNTETQAFKKIIHSVRTSIETGLALSESLRAFSYCFDHFSCYLIYIGEQSGTLPAILKRIADHKEKILVYKRQLQQALLYPITVVSVSLIIIMIMLIFVVPRFAEIFQNMHGTLPRFTVFIIDVSQAIKSNYDLLLFSILLLFYFRNRFLPIIWKCPILKTLYQKNGLSHFAYQLAITLKAGIPITDALQIMMNAPHSFYSKFLPRIYQELNNGSFLSEVLHSTSSFPTLMVQMIKVGEESGTLEEMLEKISEIYTAEVDHFLKNLNHLLEPLIMVVLGVLIGGLVIAMYLPIFRLGAEI